MESSVAVPTITPVPETTRKRRPARRWVVGAAVAVAAAALVGALAIASDTDAPANRVVATDSATELDIHGIPTSWSGRAAAP